MNTHTITANIDFHYKGQHFKLSTILNIADIIDNDNFYESIYLSIAKSNNIGLYSYELEVMMDQSIIFTDATGIAKDCLDENGDLKLDLLQQKRHILQIQEIIDEYLVDIKNHKNINTALNAAFLLGKQAISK